MELKCTRELVARYTSASTRLIDSKVLEDAGYQDVVSLCIERPRVGIVKLYKCQAKSGRTTRAWLKCKFVDVFEGKLRE